MLSGWDGPGFCKVDVETSRDKGAVSDEGEEPEVKDHGTRGKRWRRGCQSWAGSSLLLARHLPQVSVGVREKTSRKNWRSRFCDESVRRYFREALAIL